MSTSMNRTESDPFSARRGKPSRVTTKGRHPSQLGYLLTWDSALLPGDSDRHHLPVTNLLPVLLRRHEAPRLNRTDATSIHERWPESGE